MPYVITTTRYPLATGALQGRFRRAVATLAEVRTTYPSYRVSGSGGTIGPLPDGTVVEVDRIDGYELAVLIDGHRPPLKKTLGLHDGELCDAFNAREAANA